MGNARTRVGALEVVGTCDVFAALLCPSADPAAVCDEAAIDCLVIAFELESATVGRASDASSLSSLLSRAAHLLRFEKGGSFHVAKQQI